MIGIRTRFALIWWKSALSRCSFYVFCGVVVVVEGSHANVSWLTAGYSAPSVDSHADVTYDVERGDEYDHEYAHNEYADEDDDAAWLHSGSADMSCIGVRKRCLIDGRCARQLANYRHYCRENKKQNECVAIER